MPPNSARGQPLGGPPSHARVVLFTHNGSGRLQGLFWCFNGFRELRLLTEHLGPHQPIHGVRSGYRLMEYTDHNVAAIATTYAAEVIALQPEGTVLLAGVAIAKAVGSLAPSRCG